MDPNLVRSLVLMGVMLAFFYFVAIRPQQKREKEIKKMRDALKVGDEVLTIGGIKGKIVIAKEDYVSIETSGMNTRLEVARWGINSILNEK